MGYYTTPNEPAYDHCSAHGCDIDVERGEEVYHCRHEDCRSKKLCIGCLFTCTDCGADFCEHHVVDLFAGEGPGAEYVCFPCKKLRDEPKGPPRLHPLFEQILKPFLNPKEAA
jgi:hypothetical protein